MKRLMSLNLLLILVVHASGCSFFVPHTQPISVTTSEKDAQIFINGNLAGVGSVQESVTRNREVAIMAKKDGYYPAMRTIGKTLSTTGILDIIGGFIILVPFLGLISPGAWQIEQTNISLMMAKDKG